MTLLATPYFWEFEGKGSYVNDRNKLYLEITYHANKRANERNVRRDSILALAEMCGRSRTIQTLQQDVFYIRYLGNSDYESLLIPFAIKRMGSGDLVLYAKTIWRFLNENDDFRYRKGQPIFELSFARSGEAVIEPLDASALSQNIRK